MNTLIKLFHRPVQRACRILRYTMGVNVVKEPEQDRRSVVDRDLAEVLVSCLTTPDVTEFAAKQGKRVLEILRTLNQLPGGTMSTLGKWRVILIK